MILKEDCCKIAKDFSSPHRLQTAFPCCSVLGTAVVPLRIIAAAWGGVILLSNHITQIPTFFSSFSTRLTEAKSILLQLKTLPGCPCPHRTLLGHPLPSSCSCLLQMVSDPISSCAQQMEILTLCTLLHNFPLSLQAAFLQLPASCAFLTWFWLHFLPINLLHLCPVTSNTILPIAGSSSHLQSAGYRRGLVILGWVSCTGVPLSLAMPAVQLANT